MLVSAKNRLQDLIAASHFLKEHENYGQKKQILAVLSQSDIKLGDAMKIARTVIAESKKHDIPVSLFLAIMKKESNFDVNARSPVNAMGIMQIHPLTWDAYTRKLDLDLSRNMAFDPVFNIMVSAALLSDLRALGIFYLLFSSFQTTKESIILKRYQVFHDIRRYFR
jgi:soluble lytic murein transglycosylase-like protein